MIREDLAPAKVNLYLHVGPVQADGYHPVETLMVFADLGDRVRLEPDRPGFVVEGPFAGPLNAEADNLVTRARDLFLDAFGGPQPGLTLDKRLPIAAGLGGGSSDAAAALRLLAHVQGVREDDERLIDIARRLGADVPACLRRRTVIGRGRGDELTPGPNLPTLPAVLVNPGVPSPTGAVYRAFDTRPSPGPLSATDSGPLEEPAAVAAWLAATRNDLEAPAVTLTPAIAAAMSEIAREPESLFTRMSGSGATVFALCRSGDAARRLSERLGSRHREWWVAPCTLGATP